MVSLKTGAKTPTVSPIIAFDWEAYLELQRLRSLTTDSFSLNCLEDACDRLLETPNRSSMGKTLARSLVRDSRKNSRLVRHQCSLLDDAHRLAADAPNPREVLEGAEDDIEIEHVISQGFARLDARQRAAIDLKFSGKQVCTAAQQLGVKPRQFRNLVNGALTEMRKCIKADTGGYQHL